MSRMLPPPGLDRLFNVEIAFQSIYLGATKVKNTTQFVNTIWDPFRPNFYFNFYCVRGPGDWLVDVCKTKKEL